MSQLTTSAPVSDQQAATAESPRERPIELRVSGMHCAACSANVQRALEAIENVSSASVSVAQGRALVHGSALTAEPLIEAIRNRGYDAELIEQAAPVSEIRSEIEDRQASNEKRWRQRALIALGIWLPMAVLHWAVHAAWVPWALMVGATVVMIAAGGGFYASAWRAAKRGTTNMDTLISLGATCAYVFSLVVFLAERFGTSLQQPLYFTESAALLGLISLGHWLEARASARAGSAVRELLALQPDTAERLPAVEASLDQSTVVSTADVEPGDVLVIRPGARVPVDGTIIRGQSEVDESVVTGEPMPVRKAAGDEVTAGTMNSTGQMIIQATVDGRHTTIARIAEIVSQAQTSKAEIQKLADRVSGIFVPAVLMIAALTFGVWWLVVADPGMGIIVATTVLIVSCPCALGLATPMAVMVGSGAASRQGILIKSAQALEQMGRASHIIFDKTGTLTLGRPVVTEIQVADATMIHTSNADSEQDDLLALAAAVEQPSEHPIARAIVEAAVQRKLQIPDVENFQAIPGEGVKGMVDGRAVTVIRDEIASCKVVVDDRTVGRVQLTDDLRPDAKAAIEKLQALGLKISLLTGDRTHTAEEIGRSLGIPPEHIVAEASPQMKVDFVREVVAGRAANGERRGTVVMVGDGINDAAALAAADVGIAIASGTNIAIESADVVIPGENVTAVPQCITLADRTLGTIKQNLFFAFIYNIIMIPVAALGLLGMHGPLWAAGAMGLSDITVVGNALRLKRRLSRMGTRG